MNDEKGCVCSLSSSVSPAHTPAHTCMHTHTEASSFHLVRVGGVVAA